LHRLRLASVALVVALAAGCDSTPTAPSACLSNGTLSAQIDGIAWSASCVRAANSVDLRYIEVFGDALDGTQRMSFRLYATQPGTYLLGGLESTPVGMGSSAGLNTGCESHLGPCSTWFVAPCCGQPDGNGRGTIAITDLTGTSASGTFSFDLVANRGTGATGAKLVTNGRFNVRF
jgi:Family of unknown function (DUF6252)